MKLNLRLGWLKFASDGQFYFDNLATQKDYCSSATSCNTQFRTNKQFLTNFRNNRIVGTSANANTTDEFSYKSSIRSTIASVLSARTPKTALSQASR